METTLHRYLDERHDRVREHSAEAINRRLDEATRSSIDSAFRGGREVVKRRLSELDREWDIDRALMLNFALAGGLFFGIGLRRYLKAPPRLPSRRKGFLALFGAQLAFLAMHALVGWCPPTAVFRRLGFRTRAEIEAERVQLVRGAPPLK